MMNKIDFYIPSEVFRFLDTERMVFSEEPAQFYIATENNDCFLVLNNEEQCIQIPDTIMQHIVQTGKKKCPTLLYEICKTLWPLQLALVQQKNKGTTKVNIEELFASAVGHVEKEEAPVLFFGRGALSVHTAHWVSSRKDIAFSITSPAYRCAQEERIFTGSATFYLYLGQIMIKMCAVCQKNVFIVSKMVRVEDIPYKNLYARHTDIATVYEKYRNTKQNRIVKLFTKGAINA